MAKLIYSVLASLDGYIEDPSGKFDWAAPDAEVHAFVNDLERPVGTHLYGRRMYETMRFWEDPPELGSQPAHIQDYAAIWQAAKTRIEPEFDAEAVRRLKAESSGEVSVGGPELAAQAIAAGLVDEYQLLFVSVIVGGGKRALPDGVRTDLELADERRFENGTVYLRYQTR